MAHILFICCGVIWGANFAIMADALALVGPLGLAVCRLGIGTVVFCLLWRWRKDPWPLGRRDFLPLLGLAIFGFAAPFCIQPHMIQVFAAKAGHGSSLVGLIMGLVPLATIVVSIPMLGVYPTRRQLFGVIGGFAALVYLFWGELAFGISVHSLILASYTPICYACSNVFVKRRFGHVPPAAWVMSVLGMSTVMVFPAALMLEDLKPVESVAWPICCIAIIGVVSTGFVLLLFFKLIQGRGPLYAGMVSYLIPTVALVLGWARGEKITGHQVIALAVILVMVAITQIPERDRGGGTSMAAAS